VSEIVEFLEARIDEDEVLASAALAHEQLYADDGGFDISYQWARMTVHQESGGHGSAFAPGCPSPARVLRECTAKREILKDWELYKDEEFPDFGGGYASAMDDTIQSLAAAYADHPDYRWAQSQ
jgi:hypothetical protein